MSLAKDFEIELYSRVDEVLHYLWDPIGVAGSPGARDEYYSYLPKIYEYVLGNSEDAIADELYRIEKEMMGLESKKENCRKTAITLIEWKNSLERKYKNLSI
jgi:hypothetical protein